jgi:DNA-binding transcriptional ArsR family regulator
MEFMNRKDFYRDLALIGKALDSPDRLRILDALCQSERSVYSLAKHLGIKVGLVSHHLQKLKSAGMLTVRKEGKYSVYSVSCSDVYTLLLSLKSISSEILPSIRLHCSELNQSRCFFSLPEGRNLKDLVQSGEVVLLDLRPVEEFHSAHLPGAMSIPLDSLHNRMDSLPRNSTILAYCSDFYCDHADRAVGQLRDAGYDACLINDSVSERISTCSEVETDR